MSDFVALLGAKGGPAIRTGSPMPTSSVLSLGGLSVEALPSIHPPLTESWSLSFRAGGKHVVFSGDTAHNPALAGFARGARTSGA